MLTMQYLIGIPENLKENGLSKTFLVRRETIHLKHILDVMCNKTTGLMYDLGTYLKIYSKIFNNLYKIDREYNHSIKEILTVKKDKFCDYIKLFFSLNPVIYLDENLSYHFIANFKMEYKCYDIKIINIKNEHPENLVVNSFNFVIGAEGANLEGYWFYNFKTYHYKNKTIRNFSLYDKK